MTVYQRAVELERQLAEAQGLEVAFVSSSGTVWIRNGEGTPDWRPRAAREVADSMNLMLEVGVWPREAKTEAGPAFEVVDRDGVVCHCEPYDPADDDDRKALLLCAVVAGAIAVLKRSPKP